MPCPYTLIADVARSEMSRNALNGWEKFKLPPSDRHIDSLLDKLRTTSDTKSKTTA